MVNTVWDGTIAEEVLRNLKKLQNSWKKQSGYDTIEEAQSVAYELNEEMEKMREEGALDLRDYRTAYVKEPGEKR